MVRFTKWGIIGLAAALVAVLPVFAGDVPAASQARVVQYLDALPMAFEANRGQADPQVLFQARGQGYGLFLTAGEAVLSLVGDRGQKQPAVLRMRLVGSNPETGVSGLEALPGKVNYFIGNDRAKWRTDIATFAKVRYANVYPGIDLVFYGTGRQLEFDFVLKPGANPDKILMDFKGAEKLTVSPEGDLVIGLPGGELHQRKPVVYQETPEGKKLLDGTFVAKGSHQAGFRVAGYDKTKALSIDPVLTYSSFLGGAGAENDNLYNGIAVDGSGNAYVVGCTSSNPFPTTIGAYSTVFFGGTYDAFVTKVNPGGTAMTFSTYVGGGGDDFATSVALDSSNNVYVGGYTTSNNLPTTGTSMQPALAGPQDGFVAKVKADGTSLLYCTYWGGTGNESIQAIKVDSSGRAYVAGWTDSVNFPVVYPYQAALGAVGATNAFVVRLTAGATYPPDFSTYLGGNTNDVAYGLALDGSGNAYVVGTTFSNNFPTVTPYQAALSGGQDGFVSKLSFNGTTHVLSLVYSTYLGGTGMENAWSVAVDSSGSAYVAGETTSTDFPVVGPLQAQFMGVWDATVTKFAASGTSLVYSTYLGGTGTDGWTHIAVDGTGNAHVAGWTTSTDFPTCNPITGYTLGGGDVFYTKLTAAGNVMAESTRLGSTANDLACAIAADTSGSAYLTGATYDATAGGPPNGFPNLGGFQPTPGVAPDAFVTKLGPKTGCAFTCGANVPVAGSTGFPVNFTGTVTATGCAGVTYTWVFGDATPNGTTASTTHIYAVASPAVPGYYVWTFTVTDAGGNTCTQTGHIVVGTCALTCGVATVVVGTPVHFSTTAAIPVGACTGTITYTWNFGDGSTGTGLAVDHTYATGGTYTWTMTAQVDSSATCTLTGTITIPVVCAVTCTATAPAAAAVETPVTFTGTATPTNCTGSTPIYAWAFGDGGTSSLLSTTHTYTNTGTWTWTFTVTVGAATCTKTGTITICSLTCSAAAAPTVGLAPLTVNFAAADQPGCAGALTYDWNFGDGTAHSAAQQVAHTYTAAGTYTWTMTATVNGLACTQTGTISVCALTCTASVPTTGKAGYPVAFTSTSNLAYCTGTPAYLWVFGDGGTSVIPSPQHTYDHGGTYYWTLTVTEAGGTCTKAGTISISNPPIVAWLKARHVPDFNIVVRGKNLLPGIAVYINGVPVPSITLKPHTFDNLIVYDKIILNGGPPLKAIAPPNLPLQFHFVNPDGADFTVIWQYSH